jgi:replicative DNA helicase
MDKALDLPRNEQAEASLLGGLMFAPDNLAEVMALVEPQDFWRPANGDIFRAIQDLYIEGSQPEAPPVIDLLKSRGALENVGGPPAIIGLLNQAGAPAGLTKLAEIVAEKATLRRLITASVEIRDEALSSPESVTDLISEAEEKLYRVSEGKRDETIRPVRSIVGETLTNLDAILQNEGDITGLPTGYHGLDKLTSGFHPSQFIVVGARPSMGKSAFALGLAAHVAIRENRPVLFFSLEMGREELLQRLIASEGMVPINAIRNGNMMEDHWFRSSEAVARFQNAPLWIDDNPSVKVADIRAKARKFKSRYGDLGLVVIDYLQLMTGRAGAESRQVEVSEISRGCKVMSKDLEAPVVALAQLSRGLEARTDKRPMLSDLRESGSLEQDADDVIFLYRDEIYVPDTEFRNTAEIIVAKQRSGPTGKVRVGYLGKYTKFLNLATA